MERVEQKLEGKPPKGRGLLSHSAEKKVAIIILRDAKGDFFVHQRRLNHGDCPGKYGLGAGGWFDFDGTNKDRDEAAKQKLKEETGITTSPEYIFNFDSAPEFDKRRVYVFEAIVNRELVTNRIGWIMMGWKTEGEVDALKDKLCPDAVEVWESYKFYMRSIEAVSQEGSNQVIASPQLSAVEAPGKTIEKAREQLKQVALRLNIAMKDLPEADQQLLALKAKGRSYKQIMQELDLPENTIRRRLQQIGEKWKRSLTVCIPPKAATESKGRLPLNPGAEPHPGPEFKTRRRGATRARI